MTKTTLFALLAAALYCVPASAQDDDVDESIFIDTEGESCLSVTRIRRTEVIDDNTIIFYMRGGDIYVNQLPRRCPGLKRNDRFMYEVDLGRLCDVDLITVLERLGPSPLSPGFRCSLGEFFAIDEPTLAMLKSNDDVEARPPVEVNPIELPPEDVEDANSAVEPEDAEQ